MKYIVIKSKMDIERAMSIITDKKNTDFEYGVRFKTPDGKTFCNVFVHRIYYDYSSVVSGDPIDHYDILGSGTILGTVQGVYPNITNEEVLELRSRTIYLNVLDKMNDPEFYKRWMKFHDPKTGFTVVVPKKKYKAKEKLKLINIKNQGGNYDEIHSYKK